MPIKLIIAGSRTLYPTPEEIDAEVLKMPIWGDATPDIARVREVISMVVSGRSPGGGTDIAGEDWATARGIPIHAEPITDEDWKRWGKYLGPKIRNARMAEVGDAGLIWWDGKSNGSTDMAMRLKIRSKPYEVVPMKPRKRQPGERRPRRKP